MARLLGQGVKECGVVRPGVEFPDSEQVHITDDQHSPCSQHNKWITLSIVQLSHVIIMLSGTATTCVTTPAT